MGVSDSREGSSGADKDVIVGSLQSPSLVPLCFGRTVDGTKLWRLGTSISGDVLIVRVRIASVTDILFVTTG